MQKLDKDRNVTQEYLDYVSSLKREDLETFYIGADLLVDRLNNIINELERYINEEYIYDELGMKIFDASTLQDKLQELKGSDKE